MMVTPKELRQYTHIRVRVSIWLGLIPSARRLNTACEDCGKVAECYDHRDYTEPLMVVPVCFACNKRRGQGYPQLDGPILDVEWVGKLYEAIQ